MNMKATNNRSWVIAGIVVLGLLIRLWAAWHLPVDYDEPVYLKGGFDFAQLLMDGNIKGILDYQVTYEHPPLVRLLYAIGILIQGSGTTWEAGLSSSRLISVIFGTLAVALIAGIDPLAGFFFAVQTLVVKYTSQAYLEALPLFASIAAILTLRKSRHSLDKWFWLSAVALGLTAAGKYSYFPILGVILYLYAIEKRYSLLHSFLYFGVAGIAFLAFDPAIWTNPIERLPHSLLFHTEYAQGEHVQEVGYPWYQPFLWISRSWGFDWHPDVIFYFGIDGLIALLSIVGLVVSRNKQRWLLVWAVTGLFFLMVWPTKWPQYTLVLLPAMCLLAAEAARSIYSKLREQETYWEWFSTMFPRPSRKFLIAIGVVLLVMLLIGGVNALLLGIGRLGWSEITSATTGLPSEMVYDLISLPDGRMVIGTEDGLAFWQPATEKVLMDQWEVFNTRNSPLPSDRVISLAYSPEAVLWVGTSHGLARVEGDEWEIYRNADLGISDDQINGIVIGSDARIWLATMDGVVVKNRDGWQNFESSNSGLGSNSVFAIAIQRQPAGDVLWFGTIAGVSSYDTTTEKWQTFTASDLTLGWGGVSDILVDSQGVVWVATQGGGISRYNRGAWSTLTTTNSNLPYNNVTEIAEIPTGVYWISVARPDETGGVLVRVINDEWDVFRPNLTGFSGGEVMAVERDLSGRYWFATRTMGINIYASNR
jgi:hypothetical protein